MNIYQESSRLILRNTLLSDCTFFAQWEQTAFIQEFFTMEKDRSYEDISSEFLSRQTDPCSFDLTLICSCSLLPIGRIYFSRYDRHYDSIDLTRIYIGDSSYLHRGYGKEGLGLALKFAFEQLGVHRLTLDYFDGNLRAQRLYESVGFVHEGRMRDAGKKNGRYYHLNLMSLLFEEWQQIRECFWQ